MAKVNNNKNFRELKWKKLTKNSGVNKQIWEDEQMCRMKHSLKYIVNNLYTKFCEKNKLGLQSQEEFVLVHGYNTLFMT
jgi:hypothetical protein